MAVVQLLDLGDPIHALEACGGDGLAEGDRDLVALDVLQLGNAADANDPSFSDDGHSRACLFDLAEDVRRKKDRPAFRARLLDHGVELLLVQGIEAARRLIEDEDAGAVHEGLDEDDLALVSGRVLPELAARVEVEALDQLLQVGAVDAATQVGEVLEDLSAGEVGVEGRLAGDVADQPLDLDRLVPAVEAGDPRGARVWADQGHEASDRRRLARTVGAEESE